MGLDTVELVMAFETAFGVRIPDAEAEKMLTPRHVIDWVCQQQVAGKLFVEPGPPSPLKNKSRPLTREEIAAEIREIIFEQTGLRGFSEDDRFIEDLRLD